jgi:hypothetical protein
LLAIRFFLAALLTTVTASATLLEFTPPAPTSATPVAITITSDPGSPCPPTLGSVTRNGKSVRVDLLPWTGGCILIVAPWKATFELGTFNPGEYDLSVFLGSAPLVTSKFVVREANPPFTVRPFANVSRPAGPQTDPGALATLDNVSAAQICTTNACTNAKVMFGDVAAQPRFEGGRLVVPVPPHAPGVVDVRIVATDRELNLVSRGAAYFYDRAAAPDLTVWERELFPVLFSGPGAFGAQWTTDAVIFNGNNWLVENFNRVDSLQCFDVGCERYAAGEYRKFEGRDHPYGAVLLTPRESAAKFSFATRVRDKAREAEDFGTEIPVIREGAMHRERDGFRLLDIPVTSAYRSKLRVYVYGADASNLQVSVYGSNGDREVFLRRFPLTAVDAQLSYAEVDLQTIPEVEGDRMALRIVPPSELPTWAFVSVTNNTTQRVTIVTPN